MQTTTGTHQHRSSRTTDGIVVPEPLRILLPKHIKTIPELMKDAGYFTFNSGKDDYNFHYDRKNLYDTGTATDYKAGLNGWQGNKSVGYGKFVDAPWNDRKDKSQPWFGQYTLHGGKGNTKYVREGELLEVNEVPLPPYFPDIPAQREAWTLHYNAVRGTDVEVEEILEKLKADGQLENTIIFFFSDHGSNHSLRHKQFCYEGGVHVPLIISGNHPDLIAGTRRREIITALDIPATTLAFGGVTLPSYLDGQDLFSRQYKNQDYVVSARDRCDYTIDRIRTVRSNKYRYIKNYHPERTMMQAQYRDNRKIVIDLKKANENGGLTTYQKEHWFGKRPVEELYDIEADPHQMNNLALDGAFTEILKNHRDYLENWMKTTDDKGQYPESAIQLQATYDLWKERPIFKNATANPEYDQFKTK